MDEQLRVNRNSTPPLSGMRVDNVRAVYGNGDIRDIHDIDNEKDPRLLLAFKQSQHRHYSVAIVLVVPAG